MQRRPKIQPAQQSTLAINTDNRTQCIDCKRYFPAEGLEQLLPVRIAWRSFVGTELLCTQCRCTAYNTFNESLPPGVDAYVDPVTGTTIVPRITEAEARQQYCLTSCHFITMPHSITAHQVKKSGHHHDVRLYEERDVIREAHFVRGGDIGIANARKAFAEQRHHVELPPVGEVRARRNRIREAFLNEGYFFASPELTFVNSYVEHGVGNLSAVVKYYCH